MTSYRRVLRIFIASPGDLGSERKAAKAVVDEVTLTARELGVSLELDGWEDTLPGANRPQDVINRDLDEADLFVGLLWRRWGQPTGHPDYTSGFEEEFYRTRERRSKTGSPEMWQFFKAIDPDQRRDPGEQLKKVLLFRERCEAEKQILFQDFSTTEDWIALFRSNLTRHVAREFRNATSEPTVEALTHPGSKQIKSAFPAEPGQKSPSLLPLAELLRNLADGSNPQALATSDLGLGPARLYLLGLSLLAESNTSSELAGTHEINTLYRLRQDFDPLSIELSLLRRTVLADRDRVKPGWYWFSSPEDIQLDYVASRAALDDDSDVRRGALTLLTAVEARREKWMPTFLDADVTTSLPTELNGVFWAYLEAIVTDSDRIAIERLIAVTKNERATRLLLIARSDSEPGFVLAEVASAPEAPSSRVLAQLKASIGKVATEVLIAAFSSRHDAIRISIASELYHREQFDEIRSAAQQDSAEDVRVLEFRDRLRAAELGGLERPTLPENLSFDVNNSLAIDRLRGLNYDQLVQMIDWLSIDGSNAYQILATEHWNIFADQLHVDMTEHFQRIRDESVQRSLSKLSLKDRDPIEVAKIRAVIEQPLEGIDPFIRGRFATAALTGIAEHGSTSDAAFVREYLSSWREREAAVGALARVGDASDAAALVQIASDSYGEARLSAARLAIRLSNNADDIIEGFLNSTHSDLVQLAFSTMEALGDKNLASKAIALLQNESSAIREIAAKLLTRLLDEQELIAMLERYYSEGVYYYNVAVEVDRAIYCHIGQDRK